MMATVMDIAAGSAGMDIANEPALNNAVEASVDTEREGNILSAAGTSEYEAWIKMKRRSQTRNLRFDFSEWSWLRRIPGTLTLTDRENISEASQGIQGKGTFGITTAAR